MNGIKLKIWDLKMVSESYVRWVLLISLVVFLSPNLSIAEETKKPRSLDSAKNLDPGRPKTRFFVRSEFKEDEAGNEVSIISPLYDFPLNSEWSVRLQAPVVSRKPSLVGNKETGMGDITMRVANKTFVNEGGATWFLALDTTWDTASDVTLGKGQNRVAPTIFGFIKLPTLGILAFPQMQTFFTLGGDDNRTDVNFTSVKFPFIKKLPDRYYLFVDPFVAWDHARDEQSTGTIDLEAGRFVNPSMMLYVRPGTTLWGDNTAFSFKYNIEVGFRLFL